VTVQSGLRPRKIETRGAKIVYVPYSRVAHVLSPGSHHAKYIRSPALCGLATWQRSQWLGLGSYQEWEHGRRLPLCSRCMRVMEGAGLFREPAPR
jgi:hypothetical protein